jgi:hypothetical protein
VNRDKQRQVTHRIARQRELNRICTERRRDDGQKAHNHNNEQINKIMPQPVSHLPISLQFDESTICYFPCAFVA